MPQVPYSGTPNVAPGGVPLSRYHADVSEATFGGNVGAAIHGLGGQLQKTGNELFERGIAMQTLYNHSEATQGVATFMERSAKLQSDYDLLKGKDAVDALPAHNESLKKLHIEIQKGLSNETSQKLFESETLRSVGQSFFHSAKHAGTENQNFALGASDARIGAIGDRALSFPKDDKAFEQGLMITEKEILAKAQLQGLSEEATNEAISLQKSKLWGQRIQGMAKQDPMQAGKWLDEAVKKGDVRGEDIGKLTNLVQQQRWTVGSRMVAKQVNTGVGTNIGMGIVPIEQAQEAIASNESGGRYNLEGPEVFSKSGASRGRALGKYQVMPENLPSWLAQSGLPPMTSAEFLKSPSAQDQVFNTIFGGYMKKYGSAQEAASVWFTGRPMAQAGNATDAQPGFRGTTAPAYVANFNAALAKNAPLAQKIAEGNRLATQQAPDDPLFPEYVEQRIKTDNDRAIAVRRDTEFQNRQVIEGGLVGDQKGKLPTTVEELTDTPEKAQAWADLLDSTQRRYMGVLSRNAKGDRNWTDASLREYQKTKGIAAADPATFLDLDVVGMDLPNSARRELINLQGRLKGKAEGDPRVAKAMQMMAPELQAAGIERKNKDDYYSYVGALEDQLKTFAEENKRPPKADEIKLMGNRLLQQQTQKGWLWNSKTPTFQVPVPSDESEKIKTDPTWGKLGITPTDSQIQRIYTRDLYQRLYGKASGSPAGTPAPNVPVSQ